MTVLTYAFISDRLVLCAMIVFVLAMIALAIGNATGTQRRRQSTAELDQLTPSTALLGGPSPDRSAGGPMTLTEPGHQDQPQPSPGRVATAARANAIGTALLVLGLVLTVVATIARGLAAGRTPWSNMYEFTVVGVVATVGAYLALVMRPRTRPLLAAGAWVAATAALFLGLALTVLYTPAAGLIPVLDSAWLVIHVAAAIVAGGLFTVGAVMSVLHLTQLRRERRSHAAAHSWPAETLEQAAQTAYTIAFPIWTFAVIAGAIWAENSWGRYWGWDPKETWAFITWVCYAAYLHAQATGGWRGKKASWLALSGYLAFLFNFIGVNIWVGGLHSYAGV